MFDITLNIFVQHPHYEDLYSFTLNSKTKIMNLINMIENYNQTHPKFTPISTYKTYYTADEGSAILPLGEGRLSDYGLISEKCMIYVKYTLPPIPTLTTLAALAVVNSDDKSIYVAETIPPPLKIRNMELWNHYCEKRRNQQLRFQNLTTTKNIFGMGGFITQVSYSYKKKQLKQIIEESDEAKEYYERHKDAWKHKTIRGKYTKQWQKRYKAFNGFAPHEALKQEIPKILCHGTVCYICGIMELDGGCAANCLKCGMNVMNAKHGRDKMEVLQHPDFYNEEEVFPKRRKLF